MAEEPNLGKHTLNEESPDKKTQQDGETVQEEKIEHNEKR